MGAFLVSVLDPASANDEALGSIDKTGKYYTVKACSASLISISPENAAEETEFTLTYNQSGAFVQRFLNQGFVITDDLPTCLDPAHTVVITAVSGRFNLLIKT